MRIAYLDCFSGISGDMFLGALLDAGVPLPLLEETTRTLGLGATLETSRVLRNGLSATKVDVLVSGVPDAPIEHGHQHGHAHSRPAPHRGLREIREIIQAAAIAEPAREIALSAFQLLAEAEGRIHQREPEDVHFHEVGAVDAIVDIVCAAVGASWLAADEWVCSPLNVGGGTVHCAHGTLPVPAPATLELLKGAPGAPIFGSEINRELVTPTGAAIVRALVTRFGPLPQLSVTATGYGAGAREFAGVANVVRLTLGKSVEAGAGLPQETVTLLESTLDDCTPQLMGYVLERLLDEGALDAFTAPVQMKKNRPGLLLTVIARPEDAERLAALLFAETTTIGIRTRNELRYALEREHVTVQSEWGPLRIKLARLNGQVVNAAPEFEDCRAAASASGVPLKQVMQEAVRLYCEQLSDLAASHRNSHHG